MISFRLYRCGLFLAIVAGLLTSPWGSSSSQAAILVERMLFNHPDGNASLPFYGLRIDNGSAQTFSFQADKNDINSSSRVTLSLFDDNTGLISGTVTHNQSPGSQEWSLSATLQVHEYYNKDASDWHVNGPANDDFYADVIDDLEVHGAIQTEGEGFLKNPNNAADRLVFDIVDVEMNLLGGGTPDFLLSDNVVRSQVFMNEYPDTGALPFMIVKGHRMSGGNNPKHPPANFMSASSLTGLGWLEEGQGNDGIRSTPQDFLFVIGAPLPEPTSFAVWTILLAVGGVVFGRRSQRTSSV